MRVIYKEVGKPAVFREVENDVKPLQSLVGGYIQAVPFDMDGLLLVCNEEGKMSGLQPNFKYHHDTVVGNVFFCRAENSDFSDVSDTDLELVNKLINLYNEAY